jgi:hypothetical protein
MPLSLLSPRLFRNTRWYLARYCGNILNKILRCNVKVWLISWQHSLVNNIIHGSMIIFLRENHSKLLILHFLLLREFVACYSQRYHINYRKSVEDKNIWSSGWWHDVYCIMTWYIANSDVKCLHVEINLSMTYSESHVYSCIDIFRMNYGLSYYYCKKEK